MKKGTEALRCAITAGTALRFALVVAPGQAMQKPHKRMTNQGANLQQGWSCPLFTQRITQRILSICFNCFQFLLFYCAWKLNSFFLLAFKTRRLLTEAASYKCSDSSLDPFENQSVQAFQNLILTYLGNFICFLISFDCFGHQNLQQAIQTFWRVWDRSWGHNLLLQVQGCLGCPNLSSNPGARCSGAVRLGVDVRPIEVCKLAVGPLHFAHPMLSPPLQDQTSISVWVD